MVGRKGVEKEMKRKRRGKGRKREEEEMRTGLRYRKGMGETDEGGKKGEDRKGGGWKKEKG